VNCKLCGLPNKLIKAHIIPESFFRESSNGQNAQLISTNVNEFPKRMPIGVYDEQILCENCEPKFEVIDDYGARVFLSQHDQFFTPVLRSNEVVGFTATDINKELLHKFVLSILWRASVSSHEFYAKVDLGPHSKAVESLIFQYDKNIAKQYTFVLARWVSTPAFDALTKIQMNPEPYRVSGVNCYFFYLGKSLVYVKVDRQPFPFEYANMELYARDELLAIARNLDSSKELQLMKTLVHGIPLKRAVRVTK
jgi:hypothetical protein